MASFVLLLKINLYTFVETLKSSNLVSDQYLRVDVARVKKMMAKEIQTEWIRG